MEKTSSPEKEPTKDIYAVLDDIVNRYEQVTAHANGLDDKLRKLVGDHKLGYLELTKDEAEKLRALVGNSLDHTSSESELFEAIANYLRSLEK